MRFRPSRVLVTATLLLTMAACGGGSSTTPGGGGSSSTSSSSQGGASGDLEAYASGLCTAVGDWADALKSESATFQQAATNITSPEDIGNVKDALVTYAGALVDETDALIAEVQALGVPDVMNGQELYDGLKAGFESARALYAQLLEGAKALTASDPTAMITAMQNLGSQLQEGAKKIQDAFSKLDDSELKGLSESVPACKDLQSTSPS